MFYNIQESDRLRDEDLFKFLQDLKRPCSVMKKLKCVPGTLKLDISPCPDEPKYCLTPELVRLQPYPGKYLTMSVIFDDDGGGGDDYDDDDDDDDDSNNHDSKWGPIVLGLRHCTSVAEAFAERFAGSIFFSFAFTHLSQRQNCANALNFRHILPFPIMDFIDHFHHMAHLFFPLLYNQLFSNLAHFQHCDVGSTFV
jgi:hypothetical protein